MPDDPRAREETTADSPSLPEEVASVLADFSKVLQRYTLYPSDHPAVRPAAEELLEGLRPLLRREGIVAFSVAPDRILYGDAETDPGRTVFATLAKRLHEHDIARLSFLAGLDADELHDLLTALRQIPQDEEDRLGRREDLDGRWKKLVVESVRYERLRLTEERARAGSEEEAGASEARGAGAKLWLGLARELQIPEELREEEGGTVVSADSISALAVAAAIEDLVGQKTPDRSVSGQFLRIVEEIGESGGEEGFDLKRRFAELVKALNAETLQKLLHEGLEPEERQRFLLTSAGWLPVGTVVDVVESSVRAGEMDVSPWMLRILGKLARHSRAGGEAPLPGAEEAFREQARRAMTGWRKGLAETGEYRDALRTAGEHPAPVAGEPEDGAAAEPERVLRMAIEMDLLSDAGVRAFQSMEREERTTEILEILEGAPEGSAVADRLWERFSTKEAIERFLREEPPNLEAVGRLVRRVGTPAARPMLDLLEESESRSVRGKLFSFLVELGPAAAEDVLPRLEDERWFVRRNMVALIAEWDELPARVPAGELASDPHPAVRREAYKLLIRSPEHRDDTVLRALTDGDPRSVGLALAAIEGEPPEGAVPLILRVLEDEEFGSEVRVLCARALAHSRRPEAREALLDMCRKRRWWLPFTHELAETSPEMLEALGILARRWEGRREVRSLLEKAAAAEDLEVRAAAAGEEVRAAAGEEMETGP